MCAARKAAVALAEFWDVLSKLENSYDVELADGVAVISSLASECNHPPRTEDLRWIDILDVTQELEDVSHHSGVMSEGITTATIPRWRCRTYDTLKNTTDDSSPAHCY
jgi:hypothetical protein